MSTILRKNKGDLIVVGSLKDALSAMEDAVKRGIGYESPYSGQKLEDQPAQGSSPASEPSTQLITFKIDPPHKNGSENFLDVMLFGESIGVVQIRVVIVGDPYPASSREFAHAIKRLKAMMTLEGAWDETIDEGHPLFSLDPHDLIEHLTAVQRGSRIKADSLEQRFAPASDDAAPSITKVKAMEPGNIVRGLLGPLEEHVGRGIGDPD